METDTPAEATPPMLSIPRYDRMHESPGQHAPCEPLPYAELESLLAQSALTPGSRELTRALLRWGRPRYFPGGGLGLDYGPLFKTAARPDLFRHHIGEVAAHLHANRIDLLVVPGMSGYPIGAMYSQVSGIPAVLLKKQTHRDLSPEPPPPGSFIIPSYTGDGDTLISADMSAVAAILEDILTRKLETGTGTIEIRIAGADEIIDKATMATAITETAPIFCHAAAETVCAQRAPEHAKELAITFVTWVTPMIKAYNRSHEVLRERFNIEPFAGLSLTSLQHEPPAVGLDGLGVVAFSPESTTT
jgi:hypothetical protein